jgi:hypothetical protein
MSILPTYEEWRKTLPEEERLFLEKFHKLAPEYPDFETFLRAWYTDLPKAL